jgi:hypothetical protein
MEERIEIAPLRIGTAIKGLIIIYGLTIVVNFILNVWMKAAPIGPWTGKDILTWYWFDNICFQLSALYWCFIFAAVGNWPFTKIQNNFSRGLVATIVCWILGWFSAKAIYWLGLGAEWAFPIIATIFFLLVFFVFTGENWLWAGFSPPRQFGLLLMTLAVCTWIITNTQIRWVPAWWFPFGQMGLATGLLGYMFRKMQQPWKTISMNLALFGGVALFLMVSSWLGVWDYRLEGLSTFWNIGGYPGDLNWLLYFMVGCSVVYGVLVPLHNWPFTKIHMPWGGFLACAFSLLLIYIVTILIKSLIGPVLKDMHEALTYGYMGVSWSFFIPLFFGIGFEKPYLWVGQKTPGTWEDVD